LKKCLGGIRSLVSDRSRTPNAESQGCSDPLEVGDNRFYQTSSRMDNPSTLLRQKNRRVHHPSIL
ncbi:MAG: hypothetical protein NTW60_01170, partial [Candidatus Wolfebacteria bacterium]|nr:hypothetical protein [Candidatus Wolfebacteria bacterium]